MRLPVIAIVFAVCLMGFQLKGPTPTPSKARQEDQKEAGPKEQKRSADDSPAPKDAAVDDALTTVMTAGNQQKAGANSKQKPPEDWWDSVNWWSAINAGLITIFTGTLAWLAYRQWCAMEQQ